MPPELTFPPGLTVRGAALGDITSVAALLRASKEFDAGEPSVTVEGVESEWMLPGLDPAIDVLLVFDRDRVVASAEVPGWRAEATVHPDARERGIGTAILQWIERRAIERAEAGTKVRVGQTVVDTSVDAISLFVRHGYTPRHTSWVLCCPDDVTIEHPALPRGVVIRPFDPGGEEEQVYRVVEDAFNEWPTREPSTFAEWQSGVTGRSDFDPTLLFVAALGDEVIGVSSGIEYEDEGWVQQLAVRRDHRNQGPAKRLLRKTFDEFRRRGSPAAALGPLFTDDDVYVSPPPSGMGAFEGRAEIETHAQRTMGLITSANRVGELTEVANGVYSGSSEFVAEAAPFVGDFEVTMEDGLMKRFEWIRVETSSS